MMNSHFAYSFKSFSNSPAGRSAYAFGRHVKCRMHQDPFSPGVTQPNVLIFSTRKLVLNEIAMPYNNGIPDSFEARGFS